MSVRGWRLAHDGLPSDLDDMQRMLSIVLEEFAVWMRTQSGQNGLRGSLVFDEVYGFLPPIASSPPPAATPRP